MCESIIPTYSVKWACYRDHNLKEWINSAPIKNSERNMQLETYGRQQTRQIIDALARKNYDQVAMLADKFDPYFNLE